MFCDQCGSENRDDARYCRKCGHPILSATSITVDTMTRAATATPIWNPNAAVNWSFLFTPAFGSYLQMLNWRALGEPQKAASARAWFYISLSILPVYLLARVLTGLYTTAQPLFVVYLFVWYFASGRRQAKYVKEKLGSDYPRKPWGRPLLGAAGAFVAYAVVASIVVATLGVSTAGP